MAANQQVPVGSSAARSAISPFFQGGEISRCPHVCSLADGFEDERLRNAPELTRHGRLRSLAGAYHCACAMILRPSLFAPLLPVRGAT